MAQHHHQKAKHTFHFDIPTTVLSVSAFILGVDAKHGMMVATAHNPSIKVGKSGGKPQNHYAALCLITQSCPTLCIPMDCSLPGSSIHGILQARILEWVAIPFSRDLPDPGLKHSSSALQTNSLLSEPP